MEPSPIFIDPHGVTDASGLEWVYMTRRDWAQLGGYIYSARMWMRAAGPCVGHKRSDSDAPVGTGVGGVNQGSK